MAALIRSLAVSGSVKADGTPNASGKVFLYSPNTTTVVAGYQDDELSEAWTTSGGGIPLDASGRVAIWVNDPVDIVIEDSEGTTVETLLGFNKTRAEQVEIENDFYTGAYTDPTSGAVTQALGGRVDLDTVLTRAGESLGANFKYQESAGATPRSYIEVIGEIHVTPQDFGALANGINDDTPAILQGITELDRRGGGTLYYPPGDYRLTSEIFLGTALASAAGISFVGAGSGATTLIQDTANTNIFSVYSTGFRLRGMTLTAGATSSANAVSIAAGDRIILEDVVTDGLFHRALFLDGVTNAVSNACTWIARSADATASGVFISNTSAHITLVGNTIQGGTTGTAITIATYGVGGDIFVGGNAFSNSATGILFETNPFVIGEFLGTGFSIIGNPTLGDLTTPFSGSGSVGDLIQYGNHIEGATSNVVSGGTVQPRPEVTGRFQRFVGTTTGVAYAVAAPQYVPTKRGFTFVLQLVNAAGGAVTGWTFAAGYKTNGAVNTDLHTTSLTFEYDDDVNVWREIARTDTLT